MPGVCVIARVGGVIARAGISPRRKGDSFKAVGEDGGEDFIIVRMLINSVYSVNML